MRKNTLRDLRAFAAIFCAAWLAPAALGQGAVGAVGVAGAGTALAQVPLFLGQNFPPLNLLVMGRDHKLYYEAYNDASDLTGDGVVDVGYKPEKIDYYGYFNNHVCYRYSGSTGHGAGKLPGASSRFVPHAAAGGSQRKQCSGAWSGDFLNYLATSRMDALRKVLYGGWRTLDSAQHTVLQAAYIPRDAHSWAKSYDPQRDAYDIARYAPLARPVAGTRHLFAITTLGESGAHAQTMLRVLNDSRWQTWDWVSQESHGNQGSAGQDVCGKGSSGSLDWDWCETDGDPRRNLPANQITDYYVKVEVCPAHNPALREDSCKRYPNHGTPIYKPTGLLHDFGENEKMYFGLLTGSYAKNIQGGVLRRNMASFAEELDAQTGQFKADVPGIVQNIDRLRLLGFDGQYYRSCLWKHDGPISAGNFDASQCFMWGNPVAEMMFEALRYFSGAGAAHSLYTYGSGAALDRNTLQLSSPPWIAPYQEENRGGGGFAHCARPVMTVLSDINPSYDYKLPGSRFQNIAAQASALQGLNVANETRAIGSAEGIHGKDFFIGQSSAGNADSAPTVKRIGDLSLVRGLAPEEPSKEGTYYSAGVARFGAREKLAGNAQGMNAVTTYSVALASPLPQIRFPVRGSPRYVTIAPFAKSVGSTNGGAANDVGGGNFQPTNQIVDYYVERVANTGAGDRDASVNGGRPYAKFRINYEDVEQGADHDMDMIVLYTIAETESGSIEVRLDSEYAAGSYIQHAGYVISGTTQDGMYLEVRDVDTPANHSSPNYRPYQFNTPPGRLPGYCRSITSENRQACKVLPLSSTRQFTPSVSGSSAAFLKDPLWYAAKYGMPGRDPRSVTSDPDNYFLVTNATTLKGQLTKAFNNMVQGSESVTTVAVELPAGPQDADSRHASVYRTTFAVEQGWSGDVIKEVWSENGSARTRQWSAAEQLAARSASQRRILFGGQSASGATLLRPFNWATLNGSDADSTAWREALDKDPASGHSDGQAQQRVAFLRGEILPRGGSALRQRPLLAGGQANLLGDIVNSSPLLVRGADYQIHQADRLEGSAQYAAFADAQAQHAPMLYVGANDGMLHALHAGTGEEVFAFIPSALREHLAVLTHAEYGSALAHRYFVDGAPVAADVYFGNAWHKVLIGSLGAGGRQIFALDITNPADPVLLWEFGAAQDARMGYALAGVNIVRLPGANGKWAALVPGGYQGDGPADEASLFVLDIASGHIIRRFTLDGAVAGESENTHPAGYLPLGNGLSRINEVNGRSGVVETAWGGDLLGNLWRFDLRAANPQAWRAQKLFVARDAAGRRQPITAAPYISAHPLGEVWGDLVVFGTGRLLTAQDKASQAQQSLYGIWDAPPAPGQENSATRPAADKTRSQLQAQHFSPLSGTHGAAGALRLSSHPVQWLDEENGDGNGRIRTWGWYVDWPRPNEKLVYDLEPYGRAVLLTTLRFDEADPCAAGMDGTLYALDPHSGGSTGYPVFDVATDPAGSPGAPPGGGNGGDICSGGCTAIQPIALPNPQGGKNFSNEGEQPIAHGLEEYGRQSWRELPANPQGAQP